MNYSKIYNPETGKMVTFNSDLGKQIFNNYVYQLGGAAIIPNKDEIKENWEKYYLGPENPTLIMRVGTMGSGKTSAVNLFLEKYLKYDPNIFSVIDLDKIITEDESYIQKFTAGMTAKAAGDLWWETQVAIGGYDITDSIVNKMLTKKKSFSTEGTGKFVCPSRKQIVKSMKSGYDVIGICPYVPYYELKNRISARAAEEGRDVSLGELQGNVIKMLPLLLDVAVMCDAFYILSNLVSKGDVPELLLSLTYDSTKFDNDQCSVYNYKDQLVEGLISNITSNKVKYVGKEEEEIYKKELAFMNTLMSTYATNLNAMPSLGSCSKLKVSTSVPTPVVTPTPVAPPSAAPAPYV